MSSSQMPKGVEHPIGNKLIGILLRCLHHRCRKALSTKSFASVRSPSINMSYSQQPKGGEQMAAMLTPCRADGCLHHRCRKALSTLCRRVVIRDRQNVFITDA